MHFIYFAPDPDFHFLKPLCLIAAIATAWTVGG